MAGCDLETQHSIRELLRLPSPAPRPLGLAADGNTLWMASRETHRLYAIDTTRWTVREESQAPGSPFGMTVLGDELRIIIGLGEKAQDRYIFRFVPGHGFKSDRIACPDLTGSHLAFDGDTLFVSQVAHRRILALDGHGNVLREIPLARASMGTTVVDGCFYAIAGDDEIENLEFWKIDARNEQPRVTVLASILFDARGLTFDGSRFWTSHRDENQIVAFEKPTQ
jgi:hypothetical protein